MKNLFVTGAEGFTGRRLVPYLQQRGYEVVGGVRNRARKLAFEKQFGKAIVCDVSDAINVARAIASVKPDGVIHLASISNAQDCEADPLAAYQSIVTGWANVLDAVRRTCNRARIVMASACEVYGNATQQPATEDAPSQPTCTYGQLKASAEAIAHTFHKNNMLDVSIVRPFHFGGPGQPENQFFASVARKILALDANNGGTIAVQDLNCKRDCMHVDDVVIAYHHVLEEGKPNRVYNVSSGRCWTVREICQAMATAAGRNNVNFEDAGSSKGEMNSLWGSNARICEEAGWQPIKTLNDAVSDLIKTCQAQKVSTQA